MITFNQNGIDYKIYFKYQRKQQQNKLSNFSKVKRKEKDSTICILENTTDKEILNEVISECSPEDNFSREVGRQITLVRTLDILSNNGLYTIYTLKYIINNYFKGRTIQLPEKESKLLNNILIDIFINNV